MVALRWSPTVTGGHPASGVLQPWGLLAPARTGGGPNPTRRVTGAGATCVVAATQDISCRCGWGWAGGFGSGGAGHVTVTDAPAGMAATALPTALLIVSADALMVSVTVARSLTTVTACRAGWSWCAASGWRA